MSEQSAQFTEPIPPAHAVTESLGAAYWSVDECRWEMLAPALPDDLADLLAPPITVAAAPCGTDVRVTGTTDPAASAAVAATRAAAAATRAADRARAAHTAPTALDRLDMLLFDPDLDHAPEAAREARPGRHRRPAHVA